jgi:16S rRNA A1518/A1519 N6-dimethyltransferase RsmA/KsgA/DIM1 with predicted DNA glycosylase/AP lyase activity
MISPEYRQLLERTHAKGPWGLASLNEIDRIVLMLNRFQITHVLDYGAGQQNLSKKLPDLIPNLIVDSYDPGIPAIANTPAPAPFVCCIDVLEHVEPEYIDQVLDDLQRVVANLGYFTVAVDPATKILEDGRNAHLIVQPVEWWAQKIQARFAIVERKGRTFIVRKK